MQVAADSMISVILNEVKHLHIFLSEKELAYELETSFYCQHV
jgi:hypothetical protein